MADGSARSFHPEETLAPRVRWFVAYPDLTDFTSARLSNKECPKIGMSGKVTGRDPVTKS